VRRVLECIADTLLTFGVLAAPILVTLALAGFIIEYPTVVGVVSGALVIPLLIIRRLK
jgi:hypothetical protein